MTHSPLKEMLASLEEIGLQATIRKATDTLPYDSAFLQIGADEKDRPLILQINDLVQNLSPEEGDMHFISFLLKAPLSIPEPKGEEVLRFLHIINKSLPLGALNYSELEKGVFFSYTLPVFETAPCIKTLFMIINSILYAQNSFFSLIEDLIEDRETVESLIE